MIALLLIIHYILLIWYFIRCSCGWLRSCSSRFDTRPWKAAVYIVWYAAAAMPAIGFLLPASPVQHFIQCFSDFWLGILLYSIMAALVILLAKLVMKCLHRLNGFRLRGRRLLATGLAAIVFVAGFCTYGTVHFHDLKTRTYDVSIEKAGDDMTIALISDLHMGYNTTASDLERDVAAINKMHPDLVCMTGDFFNNDYDAVNDPQRVVKILRKIKSRYGVYACYGNHDIDEPLLCGFTFRSTKHPVSDPRMDKLLKSADITLLQDKSVLINNSFYLTGRRNDEKPGRGSKRRETASRLLSSLDKTRPVIVMDHSPADLHRLSSAGCDLDLSGHTHAGQIFPSNFLNRIIWENSWGKEKIGSMTSIVTAGAGAFGPNMRIGTDSEVVCLHVHFTK